MRYNTEIRTYEPCSLQMNNIPRALILVHLKTRNHMNQRIPHMEPSTNSYAAAYGYSYDGLYGFTTAWKSHGVSWRHTVAELSSSSWISDGSGNVNHYFAYMPFGEICHPERSRRVDQRNGNDIRFKFTGKPACRRGRERDSETGFDNTSTPPRNCFGARYYAFLCNELFF